MSNRQPHSHFFKGHWLLLFDGSKKGKQPSVFKKVSLSGQTCSLKERWLLLFDGSKKGKQPSVFKKVSLSGQTCSL